MSKKISIILLLLCLGLFSQAQSYQKISQGVKTTVQGMDVEVAFYSPSIVRVYKTPEGSSYDKKSLVVMKEPEETFVEFAMNKEYIRLKSDALQVEVNSSTGGINFYDATGRVLLKDKDYGTQFTPFDDAGTFSYNVRQAFLLDKDEVIYGLGQQQTGKVNQRNQKLFLRNKNMSICIPFIHSVKGYGLYWDNYSPTMFTDNPQEMSFDSEVGDCADYYFIYGSNADGVIAGVRDLTGQAPLYPLWTLGFWQCRERYKSPDEVIYGLGQQQTGKVNQRNQKLFLRNKNMSICIPFIHSVKGYGLYWDNYSPTMFTDNPQEMSFDSEVGDCADYYFIYGSNADGVIAGVRDLTGQAPLYPLWTLGFWQCRERYKSPDELCEVVDEYRDRKVPLDGIIQDWQYWGCDSNWNSMKFQNPRYINKMGDKEYMKYLPNGENPDARYGTPRIKSPQEMIDYIHKRNAHIMISVWASFGPWTEMYHKMDSLNALLHFETWPPKAGVKPYDPFNPVARSIYWNEMKKNIFDLGMDGWWLDSTEPDHLEIQDKDFDTKTYLGSFRRVHNAFPLMSNKGVYEHQRATTSDKRVFLLTRSSFLGQQRYASHSWSGDVVSTWEVMRKQLAAGLNYSLCGIPYWNTDLGGFFAWKYNNDVNNIAYHELHVRWYQWGAFQPIMRSHNSSPVAVEIYQFGDKGDWAYDALEKYTHLRYRLLPYLYSTTWEVTNKAGSIIRPLVMDFPKDKKVLDMDTEYMFGRSFLVRPVTDSLYTWQDKKQNGYQKNMRKIEKTDVYLPEGSNWFDFWTGAKLAGGQTIQREVPIDIMPVYIRAGSIIPWGPAVQYATEKSWDDLEIRVYPGANATFILYEDENDNYNYEKGVYSTITFRWDDSNRTLHISDREGRYPGMLEKRKFKVVLVNHRSGEGDKPLKGGKMVNYTGTAIEVKL